jgi:hypothetical protein
MHNVDTLGLSLPYRSHRCFLDDRVQIGKTVASGRTAKTGQIASGKIRADLRQLFSDRSDSSPVVRQTDVDALWQSTKRCLIKVERPVRCPDDKNLAPTGRSTVNLHKEFGLEAAGGLVLA